jgi:hypothetical protein
MARNQEDVTLPNNYCIADAAELGCSFRIIYFILAFSELRPYLVPNVCADRINDTITANIHEVCTCFSCRQNKRRTWGRFKKHLGDLSLICGYAKEAHGYYTASADILRTCSDWLWLANCLEGLACISVLVHYPSIQRPTGLRRNSSLTTIQVRHVILKRSYLQQMVQRVAR